MLTVRVLSRKGKDLGLYPVSVSSRVVDLKKELKKKEKLEINRQRLTVLSEIKGVTTLGKELILTNDEKTWEEYGLTKELKEIKLELKDLGPQIEWKTVFLVEYFGPILVHALVYFYPNLFYGSNKDSKYHKSLTQKVAFGLILFHYFKREFETLFIHRFSNETMPFLNLFKNCSHYWIFGGFCISYFLYHPKYTAPFHNHSIIYGLTILTVLCEFGNFHAHYVLRNLRPAGTKERGIPKGQLFNIVSCANYTWELSSWICFALLTNCLTSWVFLFLSFLPMYSWAIKKHKKYKQEFSNYPKIRKAIIPFLI